MRLRNSVAFVMAVALAGLLVACGTTTRPSTMVNVSKTKGVAVTFFGGQPDSVTNLTTNWFTKYAEKKFGLDFKFDLVPSSDVATKQSLLLASGQYPQVIWDGSFTQLDALKYGKQGVLIPLNALIKKYAPSVWHAIQTIPGYKQAVTAPNGKIYSLAGESYCLYCNFANKYYVNVQDLDRYHLAMPRTTGQFTHVLEVFKEHGLIPLTGGYNVWASDVPTFLMNAFIPYNGPDSYLNVKHGKVVFAPSQNGWKEGLQYLHELYTDGLFSKVVFTQGSPAIEKLVSQGKVGVVAAGATDEFLTNYGQPGSHYADWLAIPALVGPHGMQSVPFTGSVNGLSFAITNRATRAQEVRVMKLLNFTYTLQGLQTSQFGPEGKYWHAAKKGEGGLVPGQALFSINWTPFTGYKAGDQNAGWYGWGPVYDSAVWRDRTYSTGPFAPTGQVANSQLMAEVAMAGHQPAQEYPSAVWVPAAASEQYASQQTNIDNYVSQWMDEFIVGQKSLSSQWQQYLEGLNNLGLKSYLVTSQKAMTSPEKVRIPLYESSRSEIKYLLNKAPVPPLVKKYLLESGVPATDFSASR